MNRNVLVGIIAVLALMATGVIFIVTKGSSSKKALTAQVATQNQRTDPSEVKTPSSTLMANVDVKAQKSSDAIKTDKPSTQSSSSADDKKDAPDMMSMVKERMKDPAMREQILKMTKIQMGRTFAPLFNDLRLDDAKREEFNDIMAEHTSRSMDFAFSGDAGTSHAEEALKMQSELDADLKNLFGADFPKYEEFKESIQSRQTIELLNQSLSPEEKLDPGVQENLVKALTEENKLWQNTLSGNREMNRADLSSETFDALEKNMAELNKRYLERAGSYLNKKQLKSFKDTLDQQLSMLQLGRSFIQKKQ